ncbi:MAG: preQ(1) synthase [Sulfurovum sp.]|nr:preQ(1) synthase [Sulfurovum sp.]
MKYGAQEIADFNINHEDNFWPNTHKKNYSIRIELPEFMCLCPRSGYPDFATLTLIYQPDTLVIELKALKIYINSFMHRQVSHENVVNEIYDALHSKLSPKSMKLIANFNPRGNVHTVIEIDSKDN